jgi:hypothetical protein
VVAEDFSRGSKIRDGAVPRVLLPRPRVNVGLDPGGAKEMMGGDSSEDAVGFEFGVGSTM